MDPQLATLVAKRKAALLAELDKNPDEFLRHTLSRVVGTQLPPELQDHLEESVKLEGEMTVLWAEDFTHNRSELLRSLKVSGTPASYALHFADEAPNLSSGTKVKIEGVQLGSHVAIAPGGWKQRPGGLGLDDRGGCGQRREVGDRHGAQLQRQDPELLYVQHQ